MTFKLFCHLWTMTVLIDRNFCIIYVCVFLEVWCYNINDFSLLKCSVLEKQKRNGGVSCDSLTGFQHHLNGWCCKVFDIMTMIKVMTVMALPPTTTKHFMHNFSILIRYDCIKNLEATKSKEKIIQHDCQTLLSGFNFTKKE